MTDGVTVPRLVASCMTDDGLAADPCKTGPNPAVISDPEDPKFDLEKLVSHWEKQASS